MGYWCETDRGMHPDQSSLTTVCSLTYLQLLIDTNTTTSTNPG